MAEYTPGPGPADGTARALLTCTPSLSRIPTLTHGLRSSASRLPSPPVSPALSSPSTPQGVSGNGLGGQVASGSSTWTAGMLASMRGSSPTVAAAATAADRERRASVGLGQPAPSYGPFASTTAPGTAGAGAGAGVSAGRPGLPPSLSMPRGNDSGGGGGGHRISHSGRPPTPTGSGLRSSIGGPPSAPTTLGGALAASSGSGLIRSVDFSTAVQPSAAAATAAAVAAGGGAPAEAGAARSHIQVAVRLRPLCDKERQRGDRAVWGVDQEGNVGVLDAGGGFTAKHRFDTVFGPESDNAQVAGSLALPLVGPALAGVNGTIFAYGVTSSGKTHTMMGTDPDPGVVPRIVRELFAQMEAASSARLFRVRMSVMEIYNEVLNDLLDPMRTNLKVREDARSGIVIVDGLLEAPVASAQEALGLIARGDHNRKVSATAFNEDSSRSHTITRITVESAPVPSEVDAGASTPGARVPGSRRLVSCLCLIDLAGSESARAVVSKGQRMEGSYINRSLLTLGTVMHKLAAVEGRGGVAGAAGHIPFRDSKLTRLLQPSLSGPGARVAVVCNVTPAGGQSDETANTLKFAARAKLVQVTARANEVLDDRALLRRYQKEVADLKRQLAEARRQLAEAGIGNGPGLRVSPGLAAAADADAAMAAPPADEEATAALQAERDARGIAEMEATMLKIKLARLQVYIEERGGNVGEVMFGTGTGMGGIGGYGGSALTASASERQLGGSDGAGRQSLLRTSVGEEALYLPGHMRHIASSPGLTGGVGGAGAAEAEVALGSASGWSTLGPASGPNTESGYKTAAGGQVQEPPMARTSLSGRRTSESRIPEGPGAPGLGLPVWSDEPVDREGRPIVGGSTSKRAVGSSSLLSTVADATAAATAAAARDSGTSGGDVGDLREQVAAALGAAGAAASVGGSPESDSEEDYDVHEGLMSKIQDMIEEVQVPEMASPSAASAGRSELSGTHPHSHPLPHSAGASHHHGMQPQKSPGSQPASQPGRAASPLATPPPPIRTNSASGLGSAGAHGPASVSSLARRSNTLSPTSSYAGGIDAEYDRDLELQVLNADREVLHDQLVASEAANERLTSQVEGLRRQLGTYEQLTKQAAGELADIRRLKEAFQKRLQRENDALRAQLVALGAVPVVPMHAPQGATARGAAGAQGPGQGTPFAGAAGSNYPHGHPHAHANVASRFGQHQSSVMHTMQQQIPMQAVAQQGVHSLAAFGSPAPVAQTPGLHGAGGTGLASVAATPTRVTGQATMSQSLMGSGRQRSTGIPNASLGGAAGGPSGDVGLLSEPTLSQLVLQRGASGREHGGADAGQSEIIVGSPRGAGQSGASSVRSSADDPALLALLQREVQELQLEQQAGQQQGRRAHGSPEARQQVMATVNRIEATVKGMLKDRERT
ncbi:hypothetical protein HYH02_010129 [Chlamydomonas schloesseri]|uniref:Kinesin motor domain-containing protein n=1 Tax=Chlamydomonas schloesseri TaxID=2026947 RepID=A0A835W5V2_9CHLO|nr:hypothetical protein HYH02_010129 [Chlamydomonas schloesseri]|eukprot:KAG2440545.1 hypothetical protein HYH02_010129 [Chlamydomonas schloesseri]